MTWPKYWKIRKRSTKNAKVTVNRSRNAEFQAADLNINSLTYHKFAQQQIHYAFGTPGTLVGALSVVLEPILPLEHITVPVLSLLNQLNVDAQMSTIKDDDLKSSDDDEPVWHITEKAMKNERNALFDGVGHSYHEKRTNKRSVAWRCNKHTNPNFCRSRVSQCDANFTLRVPHTCSTNLDISRDASVLMKAKAQAISNALASARGVVEKKMIVEFAKDPSRNLPVKDNIIRAKQRKKQPKFPKNPTDLQFDWAVLISFTFQICHTPYHNMYAKHHITICEHEAQLKNWFLLRLYFLFGSWTHYLKIILTNFEIKLIGLLIQTVGAGPVVMARLQRQLKTVLDSKPLCSQATHCREIVNQTVLEQRIWPTNGVKRNNNLSSAIGRCGAHRRKLRTTFWHVFISRYDGERKCDKNKREIIR
ncbi:hypothetical protein DAPPUDRAFT_110844 [Daphnia pulex]|uniref:FLYWCH-type domain-containing protein n=1 Tax=Daphnia pulex TaxID=6669 RepID=E9H7B5_DAPPU|nr:hypothetical protein DAPPUDRAFT_110844 [Daphnia pulex]|eukprot:EFX72396.1 hypothetical protein DAPPUDRAFT_110844 [Daphnia pulex]